jgi:hypothetical protein
VAQRYGVSVDENLFHQESKDLLAFSHIHRISAQAQLPAKSGQVFGELQVVCLVHRGHLQRLQLGLDGLYLLPQSRHAMAELWKRNETFLISSQQAFGALFQSSLLATQLFLTSAERIGIAGHLLTPRDFRLHQRRIFEQSDDLTPNEVVQIILSDRPVRAHLPFEPTISIRT